MFVQVFSLLKVFQGLIILAVEIRNASYVIEVGGYILEITDGLVNFKRLFEILAFPNPEKLSIVIDINFNLAAGLRTKPE